MSGSVTILIKAPNQMIDDQSIECERHWTVQELKHHLSQVYPSKPNPRGQKLIYSGKLLPDNAVLADVLKTYDGHENNTIHLVCASKDSRMTAVPLAVPSHADNLSSSSAESLHHIPSEATSGPRAASAPFVHYRQWPTGNGNLSPPLANNFYDYNQFYYPSFPSNVGTPITYPFDMPEEIWNRQMMLIRQAYGQYMTQLRDMPNARFDPRFLSEATQPQNPPEPPVQNNGHEDDAEDDIAGNRDWLEWFFFICRIMVLFSIVYFYSSPMRFVFVMTMGVILFNFNVDLERWRRRNNEGENPQQQAIPNQEPNERNSRNLIPVVWTFLSSFFLSLFPDNEDFI